MQHCPRISSTAFQEYTGRQVRIMGRVTASVSENEMTVESCDGGIVRCCNMPLQEKGTFMEVYGTVVGPGTLQVSSIYELSKNQDMDLWKNCINIQANPKFRDWI